MPRFDIEAIVTAEERYWTVVEAEDRDTAIDIFHEEAERGFMPESFDVEILYADELEERE